MSGFFSRILASLKSAAEDAVDASVDADEIAYKHLLWQMQKEADSSTDAWAGQAHSQQLAEKYGTVAALLDAKPELARYRAPDNGEGPLFWAAFYGPLSVVQRLVSMGANPVSTTTKSVLIWYNPGGMRSINRGCTTLMMAAAGGTPRLSAIFWIKVFQRMQWHWMETTTKRVIPHFTSRHGISEPPRSSACWSQPARIPTWEKKLASRLQVLQRSAVQVRCWKP